MWFRHEDDFVGHLDDIHLDPVHHGLIAAARDWPHTTFRVWVERGADPPEWGSGERPGLPAWAR